MKKADLRVRRVRSARGRERFLEAGYDLRRICAWHAPPLRRDLRKLLDRDVHPFHQHAEVDYFLALRGRQVVGRIAAIENHAHNSYWEEHIGFFGLLDATEDPEVFGALLAAVEDWGRARGLTALRGPCSFSTNEECGLLVEGFFQPPTLMMAYNPPTWPKYLETAGYQKARDLWSWWAEDALWDHRLPDIAQRIRDRLERKGERLTVRSLDPRRFEQDLQLIRRIYNSAWEKNWGFVPLTEAEISFMAREIKPVLLPELVKFVEIDGEPAAFCWGMPDYNVVLRHCRGRLGPAEALLFLLLRRRIKHFRMLTTGVVEQHRRRGLETILIVELAAEARRHGFNSCECSWLLEDNVQMNRVLEGFGCRRYRVHRIYEKAL